MTAEHAAAAPMATLAAACRDASTPTELLETAVPPLADLAGAAAAMVLERRSGEPHATVSWGMPLEIASFDLHEHTGDGEAGFAVPEAWAASGIVTVTCRELPGLWGHLVLAWTSGAGEPVEHEVAALLLVRSLAALDTEDRLHDLQSRVDTAQQLASMGDYDWHIASDTNQWSDQLYRIYGHEPQSFNASYERFLSFIHPDDREMITQVHQEAYATGEPYQMVERIIRPDGELRYLASNGQVLMDEDGTPLRFRGTCIDITDRVRAEQDRERSRRLFEELVESSPDAIVVTDASGSVVSANHQAASLLGGQPVGQPLEAILERPPDAEREVAEMLGVVATGLDGRDLVLDVRSARLGHHAEAGGEREPVDYADVGAGLVATFLRDATERLAGEAMAATLREAQVRRRQALEINDNVVQGLSAALYALEAGDLAVSTALQRRTLDAARTMMTDLLDPLDGTDLQPGELVRSEASSVAPAATRTSPGSAGAPAPPTQRGADEGHRPARVLVVDDSEDVRLLLTLKLDSVDGLEVVGEAPDGEEAVRLAAELQPDLVLLDLAMPRMDGLQALPLIRQSAPQVRVVVLSGFDDEVMADRAVRAGASRYVEKGTALSSLTQVIEETLAVA